MTSSISAVVSHVHIEPKANTANLPRRSLETFKHTIRKLSQSKIPLSPAVKAGDFVFVSGMPPIDRESGEMIEGDIKAQTKQVLENLKACLEAAGSSLDKVVKCNVYAANAGYFAAINEIYAGYFPHDPPTRTFAAVGSWPMPFDIEIECIAIA